MAAKPTSSRRAHFASSVFWSIAGAAGSRVLTLAGSVVAARLLGADAFGALGVILATVAVFGVLGALGLPLTATKHVAEFRCNDPARAGTTIRIAISLSLVSGAVMSACLLLTAPMIARHLLHAEDLASGLRASAVYLFLTVFNITSAGVLTGLESFRRIAYASMLSGSASIGLLILGTWRWGLTGAILGLSIAEAVAVALNLRIIISETRALGIPLYSRSTKNDLSLILRFSIPALLASLATLPATWVGALLLVKETDGFAQMGLFNAANRWVLAVLFLPSAVSRIILPMLSNLRGSGSSNTYRKVFRANIVATALATLLPTVVLVLLADPIMRLYGDGFESGKWVLILLAVSALPNAMNNVLGQAVVSSGAIWWRFGFDVLYGIAMFACCWLFIPAWGACGLAVAHIMAYGAAVIGMILYLWPRDRAAN